MINEFRGLLVRARRRNRSARTRDRSRGLRWVRLPDGESWGETGRNCTEIAHCPEIHAARAPTGSHELPALSHFADKSRALSGSLAGSTVSRFKFARCFIIESAILTDVLPVRRGYRVAHARALERRRALKTIELAERSDLRSRGNRPRIAQSSRSAKSWDEDLLIGAQVRIAGCAMGIRMHPQGAAAAVISDNESPW